jgi:hypothetical protein
LVFGTATRERGRGGRVNSFEEIARSENKVERHIRQLAPLAFVSPRIAETIVNVRINV